MKLRTDYVSNSSSSSFVLGKHELFTFFNITKQDILDALIESYGREAYEKRVEEKRELVKAHPDCYEGSDLADIGPIYVYDLEDEKDREKAISRWGDLLKNWHATNCSKTNDGNVAFGSNKEAFDSIVRSLYTVYGIPYYELEDWSRPDSTEIMKEYGKIDPTIVAFLKKLYVDTGIMTNLDVLKCSMARFFVHADDNDIWGDDTIEGSNGKWETGSYTYERICESVFKHLVASGKIKPEDTAFLDSMRIDDKYLSKYDKDNGMVYDFSNGKTLTWRDIDGITLTCCMHEG